MGPSKSGHAGLTPAVPGVCWLPPQPRSPLLPPGYPDHMVFAEFRRRFDVLAPHLTKKHGRNYIVVDEKRVRAPCRGQRCGLGSPAPRGAASPALTPLPPRRQ